MPGGLGTFEEIFEIIVGKQLGFHNKPIVLLNINGYWSPLLELIDRAIEQNFIKPKARELFYVTSTVADAITHLRTYKPPRASHEWFPHADELPSAAE
jgi:uncharacterized protein (TIGR00730 family)